MVGIKYEANFIFSFKYSDESNDNNMQVKGSFKALLKKLNVH